MLFSKLFADGGFAHAFPTRACTDAELLLALGAEVVLQVKQVHGARAVEADAAPGTEADAIVARRRRQDAAVAVGVRVADCVPLLLADPQSGDVAAVHAGWRGVVAGVVPAAVEALAGVRLVAAIGPCIGPCCFEVGRDVAGAIARACDPPTQRGRDRDVATLRVVVWESGNKAYVDLRAAVRAQLLALGVDEAHIDEVPGCTKHDAARFHSYRRDGADSGRMLAAIATRR
jgi:purine-nucleoside/S-methyl-5'-thioadenosine phosphorylase / adenosine deaminase